MNEKYKEFITDEMLKEAIREDKHKKYLNGLFWKFFNLSFLMIPVAMILYFIHPYLTMVGLIVMVVLLIISLIFEEKAYELDDLDPY